MTQLSWIRNMTLSIVSHKTGPVNARSPPHSAGTNPTIGAADFSNMINPQIVATHTFEDAPHLDVIIVPGGAGYFALAADVNNTVMEDFLARRSPETDYICSVCIGSVVLARAGLLEGRRATTNKGAWNWATAPEHGANITWVPSARWVQDGKIWTSSGVQAGMDMMWAFLAHIYGPIANAVVNGDEYVPHTNADWDPFSVLMNVRLLLHLRYLPLRFTDVGNVDPRSLERARMHQTRIVPMHRCPLPGRSSIHEQQRTSGATGMIVVHGICWKTPRETKPDALLLVYYVYFANFLHCTRWERCAILV
jgi:putative intracellular protease/amidase